MTATGQSCEQKIPSKHFRHLPVALAVQNLDPEPNFSRPHSCLFVGLSNPGITGAKQTYCGWSGNRAPPWMVETCWSPKSNGITHLPTGAGLFHQYVLCQLKAPGFLVSTVKVVDQLPLCAQVPCFLQSPYLIIFGPCTRHMLGRLAEDEKGALPCFFFDYRPTQTRVDRLLSSWKEETHIKPSSNCIGNIYIYTHYYTSCTLMLVSWGDGSSKRYKLVYIPVKSPYPNFLGTKNLSYPLISTAQTDYIWSTMIPCQVESH